MSSILPVRPHGGDERSDRPESHLLGVRTEAERKGRWEVRAAQWRAMELARAAFGVGVRGTLMGLRHDGALRGLLKLDVPFDSLDLHSAREKTFLEMVSDDPLMARVPLLFVVGPHGG